MAETVEQYLKGMKFKRRIFGGVDEENALAHIKKICDLYVWEQQSLQKELEESREELSEAEKTVQGYRAKLGRKDAACAKLQSELAKAQQSIQALEEEREQVRKQAEKDRESARETQTQQEREYKEFHDIMETIQNVKKDAIVKAQTEAAKEATKLRSEMMAGVEMQRRETEAQLYRLQKEIRRIQQHRDAMRHIVTTEAETIGTRIQMMEKSQEALQKETVALWDEEPEKDDFTELLDEKSGGTLNVG